jgi:RNA polymerase sigma-70 factor (ECF subfamily)
MLEEEQLLISTAKKGDRDAFGQLYGHYHPAIYRFVAAKVSFRHEAEDITHEVFLKAWKSLPSYKEKGFPFSSWLYRIARNRVIDHYRTKKNDSDIENVSDEFVKIVDDIEESIDHLIDFERVREKLSQLSSDQQDVLILKFVEDMEIAEIASILKKKEGAIRIIQHRALNKLKQLLE